MQLWFLKKNEVKTNTDAFKIWDILKARCDRDLILTS